MTPRYVASTLAETTYRTEGHVAGGRVTPARSRPPFVSTEGNSAALRSAKAFYPRLVEAAYTLDGMVIAVLGAGKIGEALIAGLLRGGHKPEELLFTARRADRALQLTDKYGVKSVETWVAVDQADVLVVSVKPQDIDAMLEELSAGMAARKLVVTVCAGLPTALFERRLGDVPVVRVMPNTLMMVGEAMSVVAVGQHATAEHVDTSRRCSSTSARL